VKLASHISIPGRLAGGLSLVALVAVLAGCGRDDVKVYQVTKENDSSQPPPGQAAPPPGQMSPAVQAEAVQPQLQFALPAGWQQIAPSEMRVASFAVTNAAGPVADVGIIPLPSAGENELALINMWRDQVQLPATNSAEAETVSVGSDPAKLFEFASTAPIIDGKFRQRIMVAMLTRGTTSWFFKMTGEDAFVTSQKDIFLQFLKSVSFGEAALAPIAAAPATPGENNNSIWTVPAGWQSLPSSQFLLAQFLIQDGSARAEVNVSEFAGEGGGLLANVNRWRRQLGLPPVAQEDDFSKMVDSVTVPGGQAEMVDMTGTDSKTGQPTRLVGVVLPQASQTWFYKLMGDQKLVAAQKDAFIKFIQSARYPDAR
jgi:hypothetical protein